jgi:energy-coupling factor transporter ATP-binding protein EcfA2
VPNIAMWGAPSSGKTTFLAALSIALTEQGAGWSVAAANEPSEEKLISMTSALNSRHAFPRATEGVHGYQWVLNGRVAETVKKRFGRETRVRPVAIGLDLADPSGEIMGSRQLADGDRKDLIERLKTGRGIVYMFDPISEFQRGDAYEHTFSMCAQLSRLLADSPDFDGRLPHHVAVCVTKFDEVRVFEVARQLGLLMRDPDDPYGFPRVHDDEARWLLSKLCEASNSGNGELVLKVLEQHFRADRIKYFVTSAIGFYTSRRTRAFDPDDPQNLLPDEKAPKKLRIRGPVHPINVVEPVLWLGERLTGLSAAGT